MIPRTELEVGCWYKVKARNFEYGRWNGTRFEGRRYKFGHWFWDQELHWDDDPHYGTVKPICKLDFEDLPTDIAESYIAHTQEV
jgi:hypothetical protein